MAGASLLFPALLLAVFLSAHALAVAEDTATPAPATPSATPATPEVNQNSGIDLPVVEGQDVLGVRIPHYNERGEMVMLVNAEVARRLDDEQIEMEAMRIDFWNEERQQYALLMPKSRYFIENRILSGNDGATIQRDDFRIEGQNLEFNLDDQTGVMLGEVTMTIRGVEALSQPE